MEAYPTEGRAAMDAVAMKLVERGLVPRTAWTAVEQ